MMGPYRRGFRRVLHDLRERRHIEAYALFLVTVTPTVVGLVADLPDRVVQPVILAALAFLIFWTTAVRERAPGAASLDTGFTPRRSRDRSPSRCRWGRCSG
jgi:hypothetical protein